MENNNSEKKKNRKILAQVFFIIIVTVFLLIVLGKWTNTFKKEYERKKLSKELSLVLDKDGERGVLSLAGAQVNEIFYGEDGFSLALNGESTWKYTSEEKINMDVWNACNNSVVNVTSRSKTAGNEALLSSTIQESGSGIVFEDMGYILTNSHVIADADSISVTLSSGKSYPATVVGNDPIDDLAVLQITASSLPQLYPATLGVSSDLRIGQKVLAIGNPYGYDRTMTSGIISGLGRAVQTSKGGVVMGMIQTDAAIGPGNSGGPLLNLHGEVIGINAAISNEETAGTSQNFAIPIDTVSQIVPDLIAEGKVERGWLDLIPIQMTPQLAKYMEMSDTSGLLISQVIKNGQAEKAGLLGGDELVSYGASQFYLGGDIIQAINGNPVQSYNDYYTALLPTKKGEKAEITVLRKGKTKKISVTLVERSADDVQSIVK